MSYLDLVQRGIDYIEEHLQDDLQPGEVAASAGMSQWHFQRIFKGLTQETLKSYIRARRFSKALESLSAGHDRILDIALEAGFESQASFTRAFKASFGVSPAAYRSGAHPVPFVGKLAFGQSYLEHLQSNLSLEPEICRMPAMTLVGMTTHFYGADSEKNNFSDKLPQLWTDFMERLGEIPHAVPEVGYGVITQTSEQSDKLSYCAALEVTRVESVPAGMAVLDLPARTYARFTHRGDITQLDHTVNYAYASWLLRSGRRHAGSSDLEIYGPAYRPDAEDSVAYYALPIL